MQRKECPECGALDTEEVHTEWTTDMIEEVRLCNECPTQFVNQYELFDKMLDKQGSSAPTRIC